MNVTSLAPAGLVLKLSSSAGAPGRHRLTGGMLLATQPSTVVQLSLLERDVDAVKAKSIALNVASAWLAMGSGSIVDMVGISPLALVDNLNARQVSAGSFVSDTTPPTLDAFSLNMTGPEPRLILTFSETMRTSTLAAAGITIQSVQNISQNTIPVYAGFLDINGNQILLRYQYNYTRYT
jgi:hypothetical protein